MKTGRHYGMDWLRIGAFALLIFYHVGMFFVPWDWHVKTASPVDWTAVPMLATNSWRLPLLFAVSGYATRMVLAKSAGPGPFVRDRSARLLIPLIFAAIFIIPAQPWVELSFKHGYRQSFGTFFVQDYFRFGELNGIVLPTWQHLWFVVYLWVYTMLLAAAAAVLPSSLAAGLERAASWLLSGSRLLLVPILWLTMFRFVILPGHSDTHALFDDWSAHSNYLPIFLFGFLLAGAAAVWESVRSYWRIALALSLAAYAVVAAVEIAYPGDTRAPEDIMLIYRSVRIVQGWCAVVALLGIADRFWNRDAPRRAQLTEAVFPFYIVHQTIIVLAGWYLLPLQLPPLAEFVLLVAVTAAGCWAFYDLSKRMKWLRPLIGLKANRAKAPAPEPQQAGSGR